MLASRLSAVKPSPTLALTQLARELKAVGRDIIDLSAGEPDFDTPESVKQAAIAAMVRGDTKYTAVDGTPALKAAVQAKFKRDNGLDYALDEIIAATGNKQLLFNAMQATLDAGDEVIIPAPYWVSYPDMALLAGGTPVFVSCREEDGFKLRAEDLAAAITPRSKWLILCSPSNPTGSTYSQAELGMLAVVIRQHPQLLVLSDDIYEKLVFDGQQFGNILNAAPDLQPRTLIANGVSKSHAMTGWRLGYAGGPKTLIRAMALIQSQSTSNPCSISQAAAVEALNGDQGFLTGWIQEYQARRDCLVAGLNRVDGLSCATPTGAFYVYPNCAGLIGRVTADGAVLADDQAVASYLLAEAGVTALHGTACGLSPYLRMSFGNVTQARLTEAADRISAAVAKLRPVSSVAGAAA
jgi:aspartate aminotransferase